MPYSAIEIANYFLRKSFDENIKITPMKLVKLVYFAHGWNLALRDEPLLCETVEAWKFGPVLPSVYHAFKQYGSDQIVELAFPGNSNFDNIDADTKELLDQVWNAYKNYSGWQLSAISHELNSPWDVATKAQKTIIPDESIKAHYKALSTTEN
jgi:uncharacterized phage-associated protein